MKSGRFRSQQALVRENLRFAKQFVSATLPPILLEQVRELRRNFSLSLKCGDLLLLRGGWYVTHAGLIRLAKRCHCSGMQVQPVRQLSDLTTNRYAFRATVYRSTRCRGFVGYGDADPSNVSPLVRGAERQTAVARDAEAPSALAVAGQCVHLPGWSERNSSGSCMSSRKASILRSLSTVSGGMPFALSSA